MVSSGSTCPGLSAAQNSEPSCKFGIGSTSTRARSIAAAVKLSSALVGVLVLLGLAEPMLYV